MAVTYSGPKFECIATYLPSAGLLKYLLRSPDFIASGSTWLKLGLFTRWPLWYANDNHLHCIQICLRECLFQDLPPFVSEGAARKSKRERKRDKAVRRELKQQKKKEEKKGREAGDQWVNDIDRNNANFEKYYRVRASSFVDRRSSLNCSSLRDKSYSAMKRNGGFSSQL
jgi:hypothetical protein